MAYRGPPLASGWNWVEKIGREVWIMPVDSRVSGGRSVQRWAKPRNASRWGDRHGRKYSTYPHCSYR